MRSAQESTDATGDQVDFTPKERRAVPTSELSSIMRRSRSYNSICAAAAYPVILKRRIFSATQKVR
jgi:hypothetical protein